jgi:hypothetical protein|tara:strand:+ start:162 stop:371 length:210 start_codon:yes stop_codon:yes gene_type:complete
MEFNPEDFPHRELKEISISNGSGFEIIFEKEDGVDDIRVWQLLYGESVYVMSIDRHKLADLIYNLEDLL